MKTLVAALVAMLLSLSSPVAQSQPLEESALYSVRAISNDKTKPRLDIWTEKWSAYSADPVSGLRRYAVMAEVISGTETGLPVFYMEAGQFGWYVRQVTREESLYSFVVESVDDIKSPGKSVGIAKLQVPGMDLVTVPLFISMETTDTGERRLTIRYVYSNGVWVTQEREYRVENPRLPLIVRERITDMDENLIHETLRTRIR